MKKILLLTFALLIASTPLALAADPDPYNLPTRNNYDPYQTSWAIDYLKDVLLRRISNDPNRFNNVFELDTDRSITTDTLLKVADPEFGKKVNKQDIESTFASHTAVAEAWAKRNQAVLDRHYPEGTTLTTSRSSEIKSLFVNIANRIKLKLIT